MSESDPVVRVTADDILALDRLAEDASPDAVQRQIVERILSMETAEEVLSAQAGAKHARELVGRALVVHGYRAAESRFEQGPSHFMILEVTEVETGESLAVTCGSVNVMAQVLKLSQLEALPVTVRLTENETASGYKVMWLVPA